MGPISGAVGSTRLVILWCAVWCGMPRSALPTECNWRRCGSPVWPQLRVLALRTAPGREVLSPIALAEDAPHFLFIGRYERNKGPDVLVEAMRLLLDGGVDTYLHLFGVGSLRELLRQRIEGYEQRIMLGDYADPACTSAYMQACDWLVIPSHVESIPLIFVDALQMRLPIVSARVGDLGGLIEKYGVGLAVEPENPVALAAAMREALGHTRDEYLPALCCGRRFRSWGVGCPRRGCAGACREGPAVKYQHDYLQHFPAVADPTTRARKAAKIRQVVEDFLGHDLTGLTCLDLGCSIGIITEELACRARMAAGLDIDGPALRYAAGQPGAKGVFLFGDGGATPFADTSFDVIVCSQVYEHSPDVPALVSEIYRLLKDDGVCFFSGPNRWAVMERHYYLPFLSWLPRSLADLYVRLAGRAREYYEHPLSAGNLRHILHRFEVHDYSMKLVTEPTVSRWRRSRCSVRGHVKLPGMDLAHYIGRWVPNFNWILTKHV